MRYIKSVAANLATLLLALTLAVVVWAAATRANDPVETLIVEVSVEIFNRPPDASLLVRPPSSVFITVEGPASALDETSPADFSAVVDLSDVPFGTLTDVPVTITGGRENVAWTSVFPETVQVNMEQIITRDIPVNLQIRGEVARGHRYENESVEPETVQITGPAPRVSQIEAGRITIFVDNAREDINETRRPTFYDLEGNVVSVTGLTVSPVEVEVIIPVVQLAGFTEKPITVNWTGEPAAGYRLLNVSVEPGSVQVTGPPTVLEDLRVHTEAVDITGLTESETLQVTLDLPDEVSLVDVQPIIVTVEIEPILTSDVIQRPVEVRALAEGLTATVEPEEVRVFLFGPLPVLDTLEEDDVRVVVEALGLITGTHVLEPIVSVAASDVEVRSVQPAVVTIVISGVVTPTEEIEEEVLLLPAPVPAQTNNPMSAGATVSFWDLVWTRFIWRAGFRLLPHGVIVI